MPKKRRSKERRTQRAENRRRRAAGGGAAEDVSVETSEDDGLDPSGRSPSADASRSKHKADGKPVAHSTEARAARMSSERRARRWKTRARNGIIAIGVGVPLITVLAFSSGLLEPHIGVEASNEGGVGRHVGQGRILNQRNRPPSSGIHYPSRARYSVSADPVPPGNWIHNLEHGGVVILYRCADGQECGEIAGQVRAQVSNVARNGAFGEVKIVGTPYQDMDTPFTVVSWRRTLPLESLDAEQILAFYDRYVDRGPERTA